MRTALLALAQRIFGASGDDFDGFLLNPFVDQGVFTFVGFLGVLRWFSAIEGDHGSASSKKRRPGETFAFGPRCGIERRHTEAEGSDGLVPIAVDLLPAAVSSSPDD
jgi:hypothetical protein